MSCVIAETDHLWVLAMLGFPAAVSMAHCTPPTDALVVPLVRSIHPSIRIRTLYEVRVIRTNKRNSKKKRQPPRPGCCSGVDPLAQSGRVSHRIGRQPGSSGRWDVAALLALHAHVTVPGRPLPMQATTCHQGRHCPPPHRVLGIEFVAHLVPLTALVPGNRPCFAAAMCSQSLIPDHRAGRADSKLH